MAVSRGLIEAMALVEFYTQRNAPGYPPEGVRKVRDSLLLTPSFGAIFYMRVDLGFPAARDDTQDNSTDGTTDSTQFHGPRTVTIDLRIFDQAFTADGSYSDIIGWDPDWDRAEYWLNVVSAWMSPSRRLALYIKYRGAAQAKYLAVRPATMSGPLVMDGTPGHLDVQLQFVCPSGKVFSFDEGTTATVDGMSRAEIRLSNIDVPGLTLPVAFPFAFPPPARGSNSIVCTGGVEYGCLIRLYSDPITASINPRITFQHVDSLGLNDYPAQSIGFANLTIPAGQYIEIDTVEKTCYLNGDRSQRTGNFLSRPYAWPELRPGLNLVNLEVGASGAGAYAAVLYNNASMT